MGMVTVRYWAAAKQAAGVAEEKVSAGTLAAVLARSSFLVDGAPVGSRPPGSVQLADAAVIEVLPPFAGG